MSVYYLTLFIYSINLPYTAMNIYQFKFMKYPIKIELSILLKLVIVVQLFLCTSKVCAQYDMDSLSTIWNNEKLDISDRLDALVLICQYNYVLKPDSILELARLGYQIADSANSQTSLSDFLHLIGATYNEIGNPDSAITFLDRAVRIKTELKDSIGLIEANIDYGNIYLDMGQYPLAIRHFNNSLLIAEVLNKLKYQVKCNANIGGIYYYMEQYEKALNYFEKGFLIAKIMEASDYMNSINVNIGMANLELGNLDKAYSCFEKSLDPNKGIKNPYHLAIAKSSMGAIEVERNNFNNALQFYQDAFRIFTKINSQYSIAATYNAIANIYFKMNSLDSAIYFDLKALSISKEIEAMDQAASAYYGLSQEYEHKGEYNKALSAYKSYASLRDSINGEESRNEVINQELHYKYQKKYVTDSINIVRKEEQIQLKMEQEEIHAAKVQWIIFLSCLGILTLVAMIWYGKSQRHKQEKKVMLQEIRLLKSYAQRQKKDDNSLLHYSLDKMKINDALKIKLNESDWNVLEALVNNPNINNREIADQIALSYEGVRSSLKKMYRCFNLKNSKENQRISLVVQALKISESRDSQ